MAVFRVCYFFLNTNSGKPRGYFKFYGTNHAGCSLRLNNRVSKGRENYIYSEHNSILRKTRERRQKEDINFAYVVRDLSILFLLLSL